MPDLHPHQNEQGHVRQGLGIEFRIVDDFRAEVTKVDANSPAARANIRPGGRITQINGASLQSLTYLQTRNLLAGEGHRPVNVEYHPQIKRASGRTFGPAQQIGLTPASYSAAASKSSALGGSTGYCFELRKQEQAKTSPSDFVVRARRLSPTDREEMGGYTGPDGCVVEEPGPVLAKSGVEAGDLVTRVNGVAVRDADEIAAAFDNLNVAVGTTDVVRVRTTRAGTLLAETLKLTVSRPMKWHPVEVKTSKLPYGATRLIDVIDLNRDQVLDYLFAGSPPGFVDGRTGCVEYLPVPLGFHIRNLHVYDITHGLALYGTFGDKAAAYWLDGSPIWTTSISIDLKSYGWKLADATGDGVTDLVTSYDSIWRVFDGVSGKLRWKGELAGNLWWKGKPLAPGGTHSYERTRGFGYRKGHSACEILGANQIELALIEGQQVWEDLSPKLQLEPQGTVKRYDAELDVSVAAGCSDRVWECAIIPQGEVKSTVFRINRCTLKATGAACLSVISISTCSSDRGTSIGPVHLGYSGPGRDHNGVWPDDGRSGEHSDPEGRLVVLDVDGDGDLDAVGVFYDESRGPTFFMADLGIGGEAVMAAGPRRMLLTIPDDVLKARYRLIRSAQVHYPRIPSPEEFERWVRQASLCVLGEALDADAVADLASQYPRNLSPRKIVELLIYKVICRSPSQESYYQLLLGRLPTSDERREERKDWSLGSDEFWARQESCFARGGVSLW